jgi:hypothetical protein
VEDREREHFRRDDRGRRADGCPRTSGATSRRWW